MKLIFVFVRLLIIVTLNIGPNYAKDWWKNGNFYQIYPRSFMDTNNDGIGDLNGITQRLIYLKDLGITGTWLSPIFKSPMVDFGYDISDYYDIHYEYGTIEDFERLVAKCKELGIRLIVDFVPNHSSDEHKWFQNSISKVAGFEDFYIWHPGRRDNITNEILPPNNWISVFRNSAWEWNEKRQQFYLHQFAIQQPDLNYRNPLVRAQMKDVLKFWLDRGVSGFRIDAVTCLIEVESDQNGMYPDEPLSNICNDPNDHCYLEHIYTQNRDETYDLVYEWREFLDNYQRENGGETRLMMTEVYAPMDKYMRYYGDGQRNGSQIPFNFVLLFETNFFSTAIDFKKFIDVWLNNMPKGEHANWVLGNHDRKRLGSRYGPTKIDLINILLNTLPGIAITYYGEEIGMTDVFVSWKDTVDLGACVTNPEVYEQFSRDPARTPFQWDNTINAGFSMAHKTWLPIADNYTTVNVDAQKLASKSHLKVFQQLISIRKHVSMRQGTYEPIVINRNVLAYERQAPGNNPYVIVLNFGNAIEIIDLKSIYPALPNRLNVVLSSIHSQFNDGDTVNSSNIQAYPDVGIIFTTSSSKLRVQFPTIFISHFYPMLIIYFKL